jgi:hypothetical protein
MLSETALNNRMTAIHRVLTRAKTRAYQGTESREMGRILDDTEYLVALLLNGDPDNRFRPYLQHIEENYDGFDGLVAAFDAAEGGIATARAESPAAATR